MVKQLSKENEKLEVHVFTSFDDLMEHIINDQPEVKKELEEEVKCPALVLLNLYEEREEMMMTRDAMSTFVLPCEPEWATKVFLDNAIIKLTEQIKAFRD